MSKYNFDLAHTRIKYGFDKIRFDKVNNIWYAITNGKEIRIESSTFCPREKREDYFRLLGYLKKSKKLRYELIKYAIYDLNIDLGLRGINTCLEDSASVNDFMSAMTPYQISQSRLYLEGGVFHKLSHIDIKNDLSSII